MKLYVIGHLEDAAQSLSNLLHVVVLAVAYLPLVASTQEPTLDETVEFLNWKLSDCLLRPSLTVESSVLTIQQTKLEIMNELSRTTFNVRPYIRQDIAGYFTIAVNMRELSTEVEIGLDVDLSWIGARVYDVVAITCAGETCFNVVDPGPDTRRIANEFDRIDNFPSSFSERWHRFYICDSDDAPRVQRTLAHMITISGGQEPPKELF